MRLSVEQHIQLLDPDTGDLITEGTPDLVMIGDTGVIVVDWKTGRPENVTPSADNLQLHAYGLAAMLKYGKSRYQVVIGHVVDGRFWTGDICEVEGDFAWQYLDRIKKAASRSDEPIVGGHCDSCFQRKYCRSWNLPVHQGESAIVPFTSAGITPANASQAVQVYESFRDAIKIMKAKLEDYVAQQGPIVDGDSEWGPSERPGRRSGPSVEECERQGLSHLIKPGKSYQVYGWKKQRRKVA